MGTLVRVLSGATILVDLQAAYAVLARHRLEHRAARTAQVDWQNADVRGVDRAVCLTEERIDLTNARAECPLVDTSFERPSEVFNNLGHMFVLMETIPLLAGLGLVPTICAPTQQSATEAGARIPDLSGDGWVLEAYGGIDVENNGKLAKDMRSLKRWSNVRTFLACRESAWLSASHSGDTATPQGTPIAPSERQSQDLRLP